MCVGGVDIDNHRSLRLMDSDGRHEYVEDCPYEIYDIWDLSYIMSSYRPAPHAAEDCNVTWRKRLGNTGYVDNLPAILKGCGMQVYAGPLTNAFGGMLKTEKSTWFISRPNVPNHSTCFWIADKNITLKHTISYGKERWSYVYLDPQHPKWGSNIPYVGVMSDPPAVIPQGTLVRLSLAHWWQKDGCDEERCYLQLSGCYLPHQE